MLAGLNITTIGLASNGGGEQTDPRATDVLATTDVLPAGRYLCIVTVTATNLDDSQAIFKIQHRDVNDDEDNVVEEAVFACPMGDCRQFQFGFKLDAGERISIVPYADMLGTVTAAINWEAQ